MARSRLDETTSVMPGAILTNIALTVPLWGVTRLSLTERYHLPPVGSTGFRVAVGVSEDSVNLAALLIGPQRFMWKFHLEFLAQMSRRADVLGRLAGGLFGDLALITGLTMRTHMHITELSFTTTSQRLETIEVSMSLRHVPKPGSLDPLLDVTAVAVSALRGG